MTNVMTYNILGTSQTFGEIADITKFICDAASGGEGGCFCVTNTHHCVLSKESSEFYEIQSNAISNISDSAVLLYAARLLGHSVLNSWAFRGYDLLEALIDESIARGLSIGFYGGSPESLSEIERKVVDKYKNPNVVFCHSPPYRPLSESEITDVCDEINLKAVDLLFVGIGVPKQDELMFRIKDRVPHTCMIGLGAAFDFFANVVRPSPSWVHKSGLEWLYRMFSEPRRLGRRYFENNTKFIIYFCFQWFSRGEKETKHS